MSVPVFSVFIFLKRSLRHPGNSFVLLLSFAFLSDTFAQDVQNRVYLTTGSMITAFRLVSTDNKEKNIEPLKAGNPRIEMGYEYYFSKRTGFLASLGYSSLSTNFHYEVADEVRDSLAAEGLEWNNFIRLNRNQDYLNFQLGYVYFPWQNEYNKLSISIISFFQYGFNSNRKVGSNLFYQNEDDFFQTFGPISFESTIEYRQLIINPNVRFRYERLLRKKQTLGCSLDFNFPVSKAYSGNMVILPEYETFRSAFSFSSNGGFVGISIFYGLGFGQFN
jgi:hypothetical protein